MISRFFIERPRFAFVISIVITLAGLISILTLPEPIADPLKFELGVDGIILRQGGRGAVFLPQVAPEQGWDQRTTLEYLSRKAGLPADGWRQPGTLFQTFRAEVFGE